MRKLYTLALASLLSFTGFSQDTFSIIAVEPETGQIGSAGASCVNGIGSQGIIDIITKILPGRGGVNSQAYVCIPNSNLNNAIEQMEMGASPSEIIDYLLNNDSCSSQGFDPEYRQYGIVDFDETVGGPRKAGFTGNMADDYKEDRQGSTFSIQGNILLNKTVIDNMEDNFNNTTGTLADKLMAAMQGANFAGADSRCLAAGTSSTTAYLLVYKPDDDIDNPYIRLNVGEQAAGIEPIDILQGLYDNLLSVEENTLSNSITIFPNPATDNITLSVAASVALSTVAIYDVQGKLMHSQNVFETQHLQQNIKIASFRSGVYFMKVTSAKEETTLRFVKK
jgi:uncharacterized Ntn-hydrolase superfamily protein